MNNIQKVASFYLGQQCNLYCDYCKLRDHSWPKMNTQLNLEVFDFLKEEHIDTIVFKEAEPMIHKDKIKEIISTSKDEFKIEITTNGSLITKNDIKYFNSHNVHMFISWDGHTESSLHRGYDVIKENKNITLIDNITILPVIRTFNALKDFINDILTLSNAHNKVFPFIINLYDEQPECFGREEDIIKYMHELCNHVYNIIHDGEKSFADATLLYSMLLMGVTHITKNEQHEITMSPHGELFQIFRTSPKTKRFVSSGTIANPNIVTSNHKCTRSRCFCELAYICCKTRSDNIGTFKELCDIRKSVFQPIYEFIEANFTRCEFIDNFIERRKQ